MRQAERRRRTTERLVDAAIDVFSERGFHSSSIDQVAEAAGLTKGAVYANFGGKDALFLAVLDRHLDEQLAAVDVLVGAESRSDLSEDLHGASRTLEGSGGTFGVLMLEFWAYAARNERARSALAARYRQMRDQLADAISRRDAAQGRTDSRSADDAAARVLALDAGLFLQHLIDPVAVTAVTRVRAIADVIDPQAPSTRRSGGDGRHDRGT